MVAREVNGSQSYALLAVNDLGVAQVGESFGMVVYAPPQSRYARESQSFALVPYARGFENVPNISQLFGMIVYRTGVPDARRSRCWWFTFDGHTFYVMDLGPEGTYVYDTLTKQWARWYTEGFDGQWNMKAGTMWGSLRIVAGDAVSGEVWVVDPNNPMDESWRIMRHVVTGGIVLRGRVYVDMAQLRLVGSAGSITNDAGTASVSMRFSDDQGKTWVGPYTVAVTEGEFEEETSWASLGSFMEPGRVIEISDEGGVIRIDALDGTLDAFDEPPSPATGGGRG